MNTKEAIEYLKGFTPAIYVEHPEIFGSEWEVIRNIKGIKAIEIVLNELEKKDRQIEERTNRIKNLEIECQKHFDNMMDTIKENTELTHKIKSYRGMLRKQRRDIAELQRNQKKIK